MSVQNSEEEATSLVKVFQNIPRKKLDEAFDKIQSTFLNKADSTITPQGAKLLEAVERYYNSNIPVDYWFRDMYDFKGDAVLKARYDEISKDVKKSYENGVSICFAGNHGSGKTMTCTCILKRVVESNRYSALYLNLTDIIHVMTSPSTALVRDKARQLLMNVDFLVIDEFDQRFMGSENAADLFGRILEPIMRTRLQNKMPLLFCTNSPNVVDGFNGPIKASIRSLMFKFRTVPVMPGKDFRQPEAKK